MTNNKKNASKNKQTENEALENEEVKNIEEEVVEAKEAENETVDEVATLKEENQKLKDAFLRAYAEAENTKKRCQQEIEKNNKFAISSFAKELLVVADNLQRALSAVSENSGKQCEALMKGVEMTQNQLTQVFAKFGIKKIDSMGKVFDPNFERVVQEVEDPKKPAGTVVAELQSAYTLNERILREAMVVVTKGGK